MPNPMNPMIIQGDKTVLLEVGNENYAPARDVLARFAELEKSPEYIHTYRITPLSLWNAAASGLDADEILAGLDEFAKYPVPGNVAHDITDHISRYGCVKLVKDEVNYPGELHLISDDKFIIVELMQQKRFTKYVIEQIDSTRLSMHPVMRGHIKQILVQLGFPAEDLAGYVKGDALKFSLRETTVGGEDFAPRHYQQEAAEIFYAGGSESGGSGTIVLPCGAGKTIVGMTVMEKVQTSTLILAPNTVAVRQWINEIVDKTTLSRDDIGEYSGKVKEIRPITVCTYQVLTYRRRGKKKEETGEGYEHFALFTARDWGLIIYDEVHLLPSPVFRITAEIQARRRLGLTATLVREDGMEGDVFSLIGPKKFDVPWKDLERQGWIATARCHEVRIHLDEGRRAEYAMAPQRSKYRVAAENPAKLPVIHRLFEKHRKDRLLVIGMYIEQLQHIARMLNAPILTGKTKIRDREKLYEQFRNGEINQLVVSKVANFSIDLPDANVAIEVSGTFGSRQEEAQRLGRILRPKKDGSIAYFYSLVTR
ncbi:MAG: DNA repair helicase XPB, partial [Chloroflexota bacterium]